MSYQNSSSQPQFSTHSKGQNSLNQNGGSYSKGQNSLRKNPIVPENKGPRDGRTTYGTGATPGGTGGTTRKKSVFLPILLVLAVLISGFLAFRYLDLRTDAPVQTQPPVQTEALKQTEAPRQTEAVRVTEPPVVLVPVEVTDAQVHARSNRYDSKEIWCYHVPQISIVSADTDWLNRRIADDFQEEFTNTANLASTLYTWGRKDNLVSLLVQYTWLDNGMQVYSLNHISAETGGEISDADILSAFNLTDGDFRELVYQRLLEHWKEQKKYIPDSQQSFMDEQIRKTVSQDNLAQARPFINSCGQLSFLAVVYNMAGSESSWVLFNAQGALYENIPACTDSHSPVSQRSGTPLIALQPDTDPADSHYCTIFIHLPKDSPLSRYNTGKQVPTQPTDSFGGSYSFSLHADGWGSDQRTLIYHLDGEYTRFSGWVVCLSFASDPKGNKPVKIYCDDVLMIDTKMSKGSQPIFFNFDLTGVQTLKIVYPRSDGSNDQATICDAYLE